MLNGEGNENGKKRKKTIGLISKKKTLYTCSTRKHSENISENISLLSYSLYIDYQWSTG